MSDSEKIQVLGGNNSRPDEWSPVQREEATKLREKMKREDPEMPQRIFGEAINILRKCGDPQKKDHKDAGIVYGLVQSGKTSSFTALSALAKDNGYCGVVIISGTTTNLCDQTYERMQKDLTSGPGIIGWQIFNNPNDENSQDVHEVIDGWGDPDRPKEFQQTALIIVMKNGTHLRNLKKIFDSLENSLRGKPFLIIDDEGDQASLNTRASRIENPDEFFEEENGGNPADMSTIYNYISTIFTTLKHKTFLQYTATPQAPLLIDKRDTLSPNFVTLLSTGKNYIGGKELFIDNPNLVEVIPKDQGEDYINQEQGPPDILLRAMRIYFLGVAAGNKLGRKDDPNRTMMVHPSRGTTSHKVYFDWVRSIKERWEKILEGSDLEAKRELIDEFKNEYHKLVETVADIPSFEELVNTGFLLYSMKETKIREVNTRTDFRILNWETEWKHYSLILVGGQTMERGFTVKGLTVTYMPRKFGVGNADTFQQRARFLGYKRQYLGYCRVFIDGQSKDAYEKYVDDEEYLRMELKRHIDSGKPLNEWKREFKLAIEFKNPTRINVLVERPLRDVNLSGRWVHTIAPHIPEEFIGANRETSNKFQSYLEGKYGAIATAGGKNYFADIGLKEANDNLLAKLNFSEINDGMFNVMKKAVESALSSDPLAPCRIYVMDKGGIRRRSLDDSGKINEGDFFQGYNSNDPTKYHGDKEEKTTDDKITIQIHILDIYKDKKDKDGTQLEKEVTAIAMWVPKIEGENIIRQRRQ
ncbi:alpha-1,4 polygalactosaminidase [Candidatus Nomurabacteria bacterium]|nr:alpha-1,4 polygalactosaminidase [Candidatus Nomurabacteria bacterium]